MGRDSRGRDSSWQVENLPHEKRLHDYRRSVVVACLLGLFALSGCGQKSPPDSPLEAATADVTATSEPVAANKETRLMDKFSPPDTNGSQPPSTDAQTPSASLDPSDDETPRIPPSANRPPQPAERLESFQALVRQAAEIPDAEVRPAADDASLAAAGIRRIEGRHLILLTDLPSQPAIDQLPTLFDAAVPKWCEYFGIEAERASSWRLLGHLMKDKSRFERLGLLPDSLPPFLNGFQRGSQLWWYDQETDYYRRHLLLHEGTHAFMSRFLGGTGPPWYMEGMAELLATHDWREGRLRLAQFPQNKESTPGWGRIKIVQDEFAARRALSLDQIMRYDLHAHLRNEPYGWSWAACAFLASHPRSSSAFRALQEQASDATIDFSRRFQQALADDWPLLNHQWHVFVAGLDYGYDVAREAIEPRESRPFDQASIEFGIAADRGWQSSGIRLEKGESVTITATGRFQLADQPSVWWSEPGGVTIHYHRGRPLGMLLAAVVNDRALPPELSPLASPQPIGAKGQIQAESGGVLYLRVNDAPASLSDNAGQVNIRVVRRADSPD